MSDDLRAFVDALTSDLRDEAALTDAATARIRADIVRLGDISIQSPNTEKKEPDHADVQSECLGTREIRRCV